MKYTFNDIPSTQNKSRQYNKAFTGSSCVSTPEYQPYYDLWCAVIKQAVRGRDVNFFKSKGFTHVCALVGLNKEAIIYNLPPKLKAKVLSNE